MTMTVALGYRWLTLSLCGTEVMGPTPMMACSPAGTCLMNCVNKFDAIHRSSSWYRSPGGFDATAQNVCIPSFFNEELHH